MQHITGFLLKTPDPHSTFTVHFQVQYLRIGQPVFHAVHMKTDSVKTGKPLVCAEPQQAILVLQPAVYQVAGQTIPHLIVQVCLLLS